MLGFFDSKHSYEFARSSSKLLCLFIHEIIPAFLLKVHYFLADLFYIYFFSSVSFSSQLIIEPSILFFAFVLSSIFLIIASVIHSFLGAISIFPISLFRISKRVSFTSSQLSSKLPLSSFRENSNMVVFPFPNK